MPGEVRVTKTAHPVEVVVHRMIHSIIRIVFLFRERKRERE